jgi:glutamine synthetase
MNQSDNAMLMGKSEKEIVQLITELTKEHYEIELKNLDDSYELVIIHSQLLKNSIKELAEKYGFKLKYCFTWPAIDLNGTTMHQSVFVKQRIID